MKIFRNIYAVAIVLLVSTTAFATSQDGADNSQDMPMMNQDGGMMMSPEMMEQIMASAKMNSEMMEQMMASGKMNTEMMEQMMASGKMNPEMMEQMMASGKMNSEMMEQMMASGKMNSKMMKQMMASGQHQNMPMMGHHKMHQMPHSGHGMGMMGGGMRNMMMHPQMMGGGMGNMTMNPQMMQMRMQHMVKMEQHLGNIESLLAKILEAQKSE